MIEQIMPHQSSMEISEEGFDIHVDVEALEDLFEDLDDFGSTFIADLDLFVDFSAETDDGSAQVQAPWDSNASRQQDNEQPIHWEIFLPSVDLNHACADSAIEECLRKRGMLDGYGIDARQEVASWEPAWKLLLINAIDANHVFADLCQHVSLPDEVVKFVLALDAKRGVPYLMQTFDRYLYTIANNVVHNHQIAEEIVNDTWLKAHRGLDTTSIFALYHLSLRSWLAQVAQRTAIDAYRKEQATKAVEQRHVRHIVDEVRLSFETPEEVALRHERAHHIRNHVAHLPPKYTQAITLRFLSDDDQELESERYKQIGAIMHCPPSTARSYVHRALRRLRQILEQERQHVPPVEPHHTR